MTRGNNEQQQQQQQSIRIPIPESISLSGSFSMTDYAHEIVLFAYGSESGRHSPRGGEAAATASIKEEGEKRRD
jgi:hypothetical protein